MTEPLALPTSARTRRELLAAAAQPALHREYRATPPVKALVTPPLAVLVYNRLAFGPRPGDLAAFAALGATDDARLAAWVEQQLYPNPADDPLLLPRLAAAGLTTLDKSLAQLWVDHHHSNDWATRIRPATETELATFLRAIYSKWQLNEVMTELWRDHFNTYAWEYYSESLFSHWDKHAIRANVFGNFRTMLEVIAHHPVMLYYLDNYVSTRGGPNENYPRELLELHTLGAENYLGVRRQNEVPRDGQNRPIGYVDDDIYEATRCLTGWTFGFNSSWQGIPDSGQFFYKEDWHDPYPKHFLGLDLPAYQVQEKDGRDVLDAVASHPGTGRHIAGKLCRRLIGDEPPQALVDQVAAQFTALWQDPQQLRKVTRTILLSPELRASWGQKVKRPFGLVVSAMRAGAIDFTLMRNDGDTDSFLWYFDRTGHSLFSWRPPDGYPDAMADWLSAEPRLHCWRLANWLVEVENASNQYRLDTLGPTLAALPAAGRSATAIVDFWLARVLGRGIDAADRDTLIDFMAAGYNPGFALPLATDEDTQDRLRSLVALIFNSPDFVWR